MTDFGIDSRLVYGTDGQSVEDKLSSHSTSLGLKANQADLTITNGNVSTLTTQLADIAIDVKQKGAKGDGVTDDTQAFVNAIATAQTYGKKVYVPDGIYMLKVSDDAFNGPNYMTYGVLQLTDNMTFEMSNNAILKVIPNSKNAYNVLMAKGTSNVTITGGQIIGDRTTHTGSTGEWGYGIFLLGAKNVTIRDTKISNCWGDGINLQYDSILGDCQNIKIDNVICDNNRRQGLSIESANNVIVTRSSFTNTNGTAPQTGIDVEPSTPSADCTNVIIDKCAFSGNASNHILLNNNKKDIKITNCIFGDSPNEAVNVNQGIVGLEISLCKFYKKGINMYATTGGVQGDALITNNRFEQINLVMGLNINTVFIGNRIIGDGSTQLVLLRESNITVKNNIIKNGTSGVWSYNYDISNSQIDDNQFVNNQKGIDLTLLNTTVNVSISRNLLKDNTQNSMFLLGLTKSVITDNQITSKSLVSDNVYYGIFINSNVDTLYIERNLIKVLGGTNKFAKAILAQNFSNNTNLFIDFNNVKDSCSTAVNEIVTTGVTNVTVNYNITNA